jgi:hypothetical protein
LFFLPRSKPFGRWQIAIIVDLGGGRISLCGGSIVSSTFILTAGNEGREKKKVKKRKEEEEKRKTKQESSVLCIWDSNGLWMLLFYFTFIFLLIPLFFSLLPAHCLKSLSG